MKSPLSIILVEDSELDAELVRHTLKADGLVCSFTRVETRSGLADALEETAVDLILSDYQLPSFDGNAALRISKDKRPEVPFIVVSGMLGEDVAIETLKAGATDYILKDRMGRLAPAVRRAIAEAEERAMRKELERQLLQTEKIEIVGRLAAGVAHDLNNLLTVINGYGEMALGHVPSNGPLHREMLAIHAAGIRAATLTKRLLSFGRQPVLQLQTVRLDEIVTNAEPLLRQLMDRNTSLTVSLDADLGYIHIDPIQIEQVLINLVTNARDAMPQGGTLRILSALCDVDQSLAASLHLAAGDYGLLVVSDTGHGIDVETQSKIFEAFFTTKESGRGTGLGLWSSRQIIRQHGGEIFVTSEAGKGATFEIYLPLSAQEPTATSPSKGLPVAAAEAPTKVPAYARILVCDDDPLIRSFLKDVLSDYYIREAANGLEAQCELRSEKFDLLITDLVMPDQDGVETVRLVKKEFPSLPIVAISGGLGAQFLHAAQLLGAQETIEKPFNRQTIRSAVERVLMPAQSYDYRN